MADDTKPLTVAEARQALETAIQYGDGVAEPIDALIAAVRAENDRKDREHPLIALYEQALTVECTCRVIEKCLRCEAIDAVLPS